MKYYPDYHPAVPPMGAAGCEWKWGDHGTQTQWNWGTILFQTVGLGATWNEVIGEGWNDWNNDGKQEYYQQIARHECLEDKDNDGYARWINNDSQKDCNDNDPLIHPPLYAFTNTEACDGLDNDCDGQIDEGIKITTNLIVAKEEFKPIAGEVAKLEGRLTFTTPMNFHWEISVRSGDNSYGPVVVDSGTGFGENSKPATIAGHWSGKNGDYVLPPGSYLVEFKVSADTCNVIASAQRTLKIVEPIENCKLNIPGNSSFNVASGNISHSQSLFFTNGGTMPIGVSLSYQSLAAHEGRLGKGWHHNYDIAVVLDSGGNATLREGSKRRHYAFSPSSSQYSSQTGDTATLTRLSFGAGYVLTERDGRKYRFDSTGRVTTSEDAYGNATRFSYPSPTQTVVTDPSNRSISLIDDNADGRVDRIVDPAGSAYNLTYHPGTNQLWQVIFPAPKAGAPRPTWTYTYDAQGFIETKTDPENNLVTYIYDAEHKVKSSVDPENQTKTLNFDPATETTTVIEKDGGVWTYIYGDGDLRSKMDPLGNVTSYTYYSNGHTLSETKPGHSIDPSVRYTVFYTYDQYGNKLTETQPVNLAATYGITAESIKDLAGLNALVPPIKEAFSYTYKYAYKDRIASSTDERGETPLTTNFAYTDQPDGAQWLKVTTVTDPDGLTTITRSYSDGRLRNTVDANNRTVIYDYDANKNLQSLTDQSTGIKTEYLNYDIFGNPRQVKVTEPGGGSKITDLEYDKLGRLSKSTRRSTKLDAQGNSTNYVTEFGYDNNGNRNFVLDAEHAGDPSKATRTVYNYKGQATSTTDALGNTTQLIYSGAGCPSCGGGVDKLTKVIDANRNETSFRYDQAGNLEKEEAPVVHAIRYEYYPSGKLHKKIDAVTERAILTFTYDIEGNLLTKLDKDGGLTTFTYTPNGRIWTATNAHISYIFDYYNNGRLKSVTDSNNRKIAYDQYDGVGQRELVTLLPGTSEQKVLDYVYDSKGRLKDIISAAGTFSFGYDTWSRRSSLTYPNGVRATYGYQQDLDWVTSLSYAGTNGNLLDIAYPQHDKVGNRKQRVENGITTDYQYNDLYQVTQAKTGAREENFGFDALGNRQTGPTVKEVPGTYSHNAANQMLKGRKFGYTYDDFGNQTSRILGDQKQWAHTWDAENRLTRAELKNDGKPVRIVEFKYDPLGRRIKKKVTDSAGTVTTTYVYDAEDIVFTFVNDGASTTTTHFVHGPGTDEPLAMLRGSEANFYHADGLGSVVSLTNGAQEVIQRYSYDAFGMLTAEKPEFGSFYSYTGREWDKEIGLYYYRARYYDPMEGRFIQKDPIGFDGGDTNLYGYVKNNVTNLKDPSGLKVEYCKDGIHQFVCKDGSCAGLHPIGNGITTLTGQIQPDARGSAQCKEIRVDGNSSCCSQSKFEACVSRKIKENMWKAHIYNYLLGEVCISWAREVIVGCEKEACN